MKLKTGFGILLLLLMVQTSFAQDWPNLKRYHSADSALEAGSAQKDRVVFMGNSITDAWASNEPEFFSKHPYIGRGISGQTTPQMLIRFQQDVVHLHPAAVVILAGTNDLAGNTGSSTLRMIEDNFASMAQIAKANHIKVILSSILPAYDYPWKKGTYPAKKIVRLNKWLKQYCRQNGFVYLNYYPHLVDKRGGMKAAYSKDGVHPNHAGYEIMEPLAVKAIHKALKK